MAEKADKKPDAAAPADGGETKAGGGKKAGGGLMAKMPVLIGLVMTLEAVVLFAGFKFLGGGPKEAHAVDLAQADAAHADAAKQKAANDRLVELNVVDIKAPNSQNGRRFIYDVSVYAAVRGASEQQVKDRIKERDALIKDRVRTIIAQMDPEKLGGGSEPGLETLRRQVKTQLEIIIGDGMIDEVLVPRCIPFRADF